MCQYGSRNICGDCKVYMSDDQISGGCLVGGICFSCSINREKVNKEKMTGMNSNNFSLNESTILALNDVAKNIQTLFEQIRDIRELRFSLSQDVGCLESRVNSLESGNNPAIQAVIHLIESSNARISEIESYKTYAHFTEKHKDGWISIFERLPKSCCRVLAMEKHGYMAVCFYNPMQNSFKELDKELNITHWQECPEPIKY